MGICVMRSVGEGGRGWAATLGDALGGQVVMDGRSFSSRSRDAEQQVFFSRAGMALGQASTRLDHSGDAETLDVGRGSSGSAGAFQAGHSRAGPALAVLQPHTTHGTQTTRTLWASSAQRLKKHARGQRADRQDRRRAQAAKRDSFTARQTAQDTHSCDTSSTGEQRQQGDDKQSRKQSGKQYAGRAWSL